METLKNWGIGLLYSIFSLLDSIIYWLIGIVYQVFMAIANINLFEDGNGLSSIVDNIYLVLGIIMLFVFSYNLLILISNPDRLTSNDEKSMSSLFKNIIISIMLLVFLPVGFQYLHVLQNNILKSGVIGRVILPNATALSNVESSDSQAGKNVALNIIQSFFYPLDSNGNALNKNACINNDSNVCKLYVEEIKKVEAGGSIKTLILNGDFKDAYFEKEFDYLFLFSTIAGGVALWLFLTFAIDIGVRVAKLAVLQIIAPIPVTTRIFKPKGGLFDRWIKDLIDTYLSLFIKLAVIYFAVFAIKLVPGIIENLLTSNETEFIVIKLFSIVIVILGILAFAKTAPKYIETLFNLKDIDLSIRKKLNDNELGKRVFTAGASGLSTMTSNIWKNRKDTDGKPAIAKALLTGAGGLVHGVHRGFKHGNVDLSEMGQAVKKARSEGTADVNKGFQFMSHPIEHIKDSRTEKLEDVKDFFGGSNISAENLQQTKALQERIKAPLELFKDIHAEEDRAKKDSIKDLLAGKAVNIPKRHVDGSVVLDENGNVVNVNTEEEISAHFNKEIAKKLRNKFSDASYADSLKSFNKSLVSELEKTRSVVGETEFQNIFANASGVDSIEQFKEMMAKVGTDKFSLDNMEDYIKIRKGIDKLTEGQSLQKMAEAKKDK